MNTPYRFVPFQNKEGLWDLYDAESDREWKLGAETETNAYEFITLSVLKVEVETLSITGNDYKCNFCDSAYDTNEVGGLLPVGYTERGIFSKCWLPVFGFHNPTNCPTCCEDTDKAIRQEINEEEVTAQARWRFHELGGVVSKWTLP